MTLTYPILNRARRVLWLVTGNDKVDALARLREGDTSIPAARFIGIKQWCWPIRRRQGRTEMKGSICVLELPPITVDLV
jgi:6-phosphogluconolactonase/Glucosamine-6-phosphate isomerase/deaminase